MSFTFNRRGLVLLMKDVLFRYLILLTATLSLVGCGSSGLTPETKEDQVARKAGQWLSALMAGDYEQALAYTTDGYQSFSSIALYKSKYLGAGQWVDAKVSAVECLEDDTCQVKSLVTYQMLRYKIKNTRPLVNTWIRTEEGWRVFHPLK